MLILNKTLYFFNILIFHSFHNTGFSGLILQLSKLRSYMDVKKGFEESQTKS